MPFRLVLRSGGGPDSPPRPFTASSVNTWIRVQASRQVALQQRCSPSVEAPVPGVQVTGPQGRGDGDGAASAADEVQSAPSVTLEFPGLRLTVRTPATADIGAGGGSRQLSAGAAALSDTPSTATARRAPGTAPGMFAGGAGMSPTPLHGSSSAAGVLGSRSGAPPTFTSDGHRSVCTRPLPTQNSAESLPSMRCLNLVLPCTLCAVAGGLCKFVCGNSALNSDCLAIRTRGPQSTVRHAVLC